MKLQYQHNALSDVYGKIKAIVLTHPGGKEGVVDSLLMGRYQGILNAFSDRVMFVFLANFQLTDLQIEEGANPAHEFTEQIDSFMEAARLESRHHIIKAHAFKAEKNSSKGEKSYAHSRWAEDPFLVIRRRDGEILFAESMFHKNAANQFVAEQIADAVGVNIKPTKLSFEGGNVRIGDDYALIGIDHLVSNMLRFYPKLPVDQLFHEDHKEKRKKIESMFSDLLGVRYIVWVGNTEKIEYETLSIPQNKQEGEQLQPIFHLDLYLTLGGKDEDGKEIVYLAEIEPKYFDGLKEKHREDFQKLSDALDWHESFFNEYSTDNPGPVFKVIRIPLGGEIKPNIFNPNLKSKVVFHSYNNSIVEWYHGVRRVYVPQYGPDFTDMSFHKLDVGCPCIEHKVERAFKLGGLSVTMVPGYFKDFAPLNGSLNCMTKVISRTSLNH